MRSICAGVRLLRTTENRELHPIHFDETANGSIQPDDSFAIEMVEIVRSSHMVADMGARSLRQLVGCVAQSNEISAGLLPAMIRETPKSRVALDRPQRRANGRLPPTNRQDPVCSPKPHSPCDQSPEPRRTNTNSSITCAGWT